jgi:hypothetical protein
MSVPLNGYIKQPFVHYTHTYRNTGMANYPGKDRCVISYRTDGTDRDSRGILFKVYNSTREVELYTPDDNKIGSRVVNVIAYYSAWSDRHQPSSHYWHYQKVRVTIEPRCVITEYLPSVLIGADQRYRIAVDGKKYLPFDFIFKPTKCNYYQIYSVLVNNKAIPPWMTIDTKRKRLIIDTANGGYAGIYTVVLSSKINHIPVV